MANKDNNEPVLYTKEQLLSRKLSWRKQDESLINSICDVMFRVVGKDFKWAKAHDKEDLHIIDLVAMNPQQAADFHKDLVNIIKRQYSCSKSMAEHETNWFYLGVGISRLENETDHKWALTEERFKSNVRYHIANWEERHNEPLVYDDGWEKELKEYVNYRGIEAVKDEQNKLREAALQG